jgi:hypothetical protein
MAGKPQGKMNFGDQDTDERIILKLILNKHSEGVQDGSNFLGIGSHGRLL